MKKKVKHKPEFLELKHPISKVPRTIGQKAADWLTKWGGSWIFIIFIGLFLFAWIAVNTSWLIFRGKWDPYPFILLNFILSTLAAIQAPIILMSQNRTYQRDRLQSQYNYHVNRKAEAEIRDIKRHLNRIEDSFGKRKKR
jgi:uncharacterized membrane protein|tara:strand:- start:1311 stop:1730 length:420 start_codon:yes stop_codon:yes gene_type:complete